ncbi:RNA polymerase subunit sigma [Sphingomonas koreensis]|nr:RNA polymerase subunit sigma [Sphingomonas koreensis]
MFSRAKPDQPIDTAPTVSPLVLARIESALLRLPRLTREIFLARRIDGMSHEEIARRTGLSETCVRRHMARAILGVDRELFRDQPP